MRRLLFFILFQCFAFTIYGQTFLNGNFEVNTISNCMIDIDNATFNSVMTNVNGIGIAQSIDIFYDIDCPIIGVAESGHYFVSVENNSVTDSTQSTIISLKLSDTLATGMNYSFCFYDRGLVFEDGIVQIGVSNSSSSFGTLIYTSPLIDTVWTMRTVSFNSPDSARYVTAKFKGFQGGALLDNFGTCESNGINNKLSSENICEIFPNPTDGNVTVQNSELNKNCRVIISNQLGQELFSETLNQKSQLLNLTSLSPGIYFVKVQMQSGTVVLKKIIKE